MFLYAVYVAIQKFENEIVHVWFFMFWIMNISCIQPKITTFLITYMHVFILFLFHKIIYCIDKTQFFRHEFKIVSKLFLFSNNLKVSYILPEGESVVATFAHL